MTSAGMSKGTGAAWLPSGSLALQLLCRSPRGRANEELQRQERPEPCSFHWPQHLASLRVHISQMLLWQQQWRACDSWIALGVTWDKWKSCGCLNYCFRPFQTQKESTVSVISQKVSSQVLIPLCVLCVCLCLVCFILLMKVHLYWIQRTLFRCYQPQCSRLWTEKKRSVIQFLPPVLMVTRYGMGIVK